MKEIRFEDFDCFGEFLDGTEEEYEVCYKCVHSIDHCNYLTTYECECDGKRRFGRECCGSWFTPKEVYKQAPAGIITP